MSVLKYRATDGTIKTLPIPGGMSGSIPQDLTDTVDQHTQDIAGLETQTTQLTTAVGAINDSLPTKYSAINPPPYPVTSVNGKTGDVTIDVGGTIVTTVRCNHMGGGGFGYSGSIPINKIAFARVYGGSGSYPVNTIVCITPIDDPDYNIAFNVFGITADFTSGSAVYSISPVDDVSYLDFYVGGFA